MQVIDPTKVPPDKWLEQATDDDLKRLTTRALLNTLRRVREFGFLPEWERNAAAHERYAFEAKLHERLRALLATREHIPNKIESRRARQLAARRGR